MTTELKRIVLAEDNPNDVELTLAALSEINLANEVIVVRDGAETMDYLFRQNSFANRPPGNPAVRAAAADPERTPVGGELGVGQCKFPS